MIHQLKTITPKKQAPLPAIGLEIRATAPQSI